MAPGPDPVEGKPLTAEERKARREKRLAKVAARGGEAAAGKKGAGGRRGKGQGAQNDKGADKKARGGKRLQTGVIPARGGGPDKAVSARKVLVIGFQKTGTTTMTDALRSLGFSVGQAAQSINLALKGKDLPAAQIDETVRSMAFDIADRADAVQDSPYPLLFKELDARYPGSKFIYLDREPDSWVKSVVGHFGSGSTVLRDWIYGEPKAVGNEEVYRKRFLDHRDEVRAYFADRPGDILSMNLADGDGWLKLVTFLGDDFLPSFPHRNKRS